MRQHSPDGPSTASTALEDGGTTGPHRAPSSREITKPTIFDLYEQVRDIAGPLELELRYAELDELVPQLVDIMWTFVGALARAHGYTDADWDTAERSFRHALDERLDRDHRVASGGKRRRRPRP